MFTKSSFEVILYIDSLISEIGLENSFFNDLMELKVFLNKYNSQDDNNRMALKYFMKSEFYMKQKKIGDAINELVYLVKNYPESKIVSLAILRLSLFYYKVEGYEESLKFSSLLQNTEFEDQGIILSGQIYQYKLDRPDEALSNYMKIINEFPQSIFFEPLRFHVREIKKEKNI
jgi:tetratricopeptide (TPR) repeat protein